jgi:hypothetical protein
MMSETTSYMIHPYKELWDHIKENKHYTQTLNDVVIMALEEKFNFKRIKIE